MSKNTENPIITGANIGQTYSTVKTVTHIVATHIWVQSLLNHLLRENAYIKIKLSQISLDKGTHFDFLVVVTLNRVVFSKNQSNR